jgi:putative endonuclease
MSLLAATRLNFFEGLIGTIDRWAARHGGSTAQAPHLELGLHGEEAAFFYLRRLGFTVVARRWRSHRYAGDLDLVAWEGGTLCFVEVKTRSSHDVAAAEAAVDEHKHKTLRRIARHYLRQIRPEPPARFDVLSIYFENGQPGEFQLIRAAFDWA